jgi:hypothetical protein
MAEHHGASELGFADKMDYREHDKTYALFLNLVKFGSIWVAAILIGMLVGLITSAGLFAGIVAFAASGAVATYLMK